MIPLRIDNYLFDLYKGGNGRVVLMILDPTTNPTGHVDVDVSVLLEALAKLLPDFAAPIPEDPDLETIENKALEAS